MATFTETQQNRYRWFAVAFAIALPALVFSQDANTILELMETELWIPTLAFLSYSLFGTGLIYVAMFRKINSIIDQNSLQFRVYPLGQWQIINWADVERAYVREFTLHGEYPKGVAGFRQGPNGLAYVIDGTYGLQINKKSGGKILLGTQRPDELQAFLAALPVAVQ